MFKYARLMCSVKKGNLEQQLNIYLNEWCIYNLCHAVTQKKIFDVTDLNEQKQNVVGKKALMQEAIDRIIE